MLNRYSPRGVRVEVNHAQADTGTVTHSILNNTFLIWCTNHGSYMLWDTQEPNCPVI